MFTMSKAIVNGTIKIRGIKLSVAVLDDVSRRRVFSEKSLANIFRLKGSNRFLKVRKNETEDLSFYLSNKYVKEFVSKELEEILRTPVFYFNKSGFVSTGFPAFVLYEICEVFLKATKKYPKNENIVLAALSANEIIMEFSGIDFVTWIDKITGYKYEEENHIILQQLAFYVDSEILSWQKEFQSNFYNEIFRIKGWDYNPYSLNRIDTIFFYTDQLIYNFLPNDLFKFKESTTFKSETGYYRVGLQDFLNHEVGKESLKNQFIKVTTILSLSKNWDHFKKQLQEIYGKNSLEIK